MPHADALARERLAALGEIAAEIAHELRNSLQVISSSAYLAGHSASTAESAPHIATIEKHARLAHTIVDSVMSLARGATGGARVGGAPTSAYPRADDASAGSRGATSLAVGAVALTDILANARLDAPPAEYEDDFEPELDVRAHPGLAARLFHALFENAIAVSAPRRCTITTRARAVGDVVVVDVVDDGPGVPDAIAGRIFEPLVSAREGGSGLGLALARRIAAACDATLDLVTSEARAEGAPPSGATFRVVLPAAPAR